MKTIVIMNEKILPICQNKKNTHQYHSSQLHLSKQIAIEQDIELNLFCLVGMLTQETKL